MPTRSVRSGRDGLADVDDKRSGIESSGGDGSHHESEQSKQEEQIVRFVKNETRQVFVLRMIVIFILLCTAAFISYLIFTITRQGETDSFDSTYEAAAAKVTETFLQIATNRMGAAGSLVVAIVAEGIALQRGWPFVTLSAFPQRTASTMRLSGAMYIGMNPLVTHEQRIAWENYTNYDMDRSWYTASRMYQSQLGLDMYDSRPPIEKDDPELNLSSGIANYIYSYKGSIDSKAYVNPPQPYYLPIWQISPVPTNRAIVNQNRAANSKASRASVTNAAVVFDGMGYSTPGFGNDTNPITSEMAWLLSMSKRRTMKYQGDAFTSVFFPLFDDFDDNRTVVGVMRIVVLWARYFEDVLTTSIKGIVFVIDNGCDMPYTYQIDGPNVILIGQGDLHDRGYDSKMRNTSLRDVRTIADGTETGMTLYQGNCTYKIRVYPSNTFADQYDTSTPFVVTMSVACVFLFTIFMFLFYDYLVERRQTAIERKALQTHKIVASLFPENVRDRLFDTDENNNNNPNKHGSSGFGNNNGANSNRLSSFVNKESSSDTNTAVADLFPGATVMFCDISGFTAWSSSREPSQVFILLQNLYQVFDTIAKRRKVFKVETIGDSYVAVTGVPEAQARHALIMTKFAGECLLKSIEVFNNLESTLGPDTGDLKLRFGLHSGPVTAGVLRGERARFQLFGDTVNTASRMESTGVPGKIQASQSTADELRMAGKPHWIRPRDDKVAAKGKGVMQTYWITPHTKAGSNDSSSDIGSSSTHSASEPIQVHESDAATIKKERLIGWIVEQLMESIKKIVTRRNMLQVKSTSIVVPVPKPGQGGLNEVVDRIALPSFNKNTSSSEKQEPSPHVVSSLRAFVSSVAAKYQDHPFHNFDHACHVTMSASKFLKRIMSMEIELDTKKLGGHQDESKVANEIASLLHDSAYGLSSDPVTIFAILFSALIHDVDHRGVSNLQLIKEDPKLAQYYSNRSVAEQNSLDIAWTIFAEDRFADLRNYIFGSQEEINRFRQVVVNVVLATDLFDKNLGELRQARWEKAFSSDMVRPDADTNSLRATVVMEYIIQASDVCHTMQHWHIYRKWNTNLFHEMILAHRAGRLELDPATFWYRGEMEFFDLYVIPLAKKLKECKVFGVAGDEILGYALKNRSEWEICGEEVVVDMMKELSDNSINESERESFSCKDIGEEKIENVSGLHSSMDREIATYAPLNDQSVAYAPLKDQAVSYAPLKDQAVTYSPLNDQAVTYAPLNDQAGAYAPLKDRIVSVSPRKEKAFMHTAAPLKDHAQWEEQRYPKLEAKVNGLAAEGNTTKDYGTLMIDKKGDVNEKKEEFTNHNNDDGYSFFFL